MAISLLAVPTDATGARGVTRVHQNHGHTHRRSLVGQKHPQLEERCWGRRLQGSGAGMEMVAEFVVGRAELGVGVMAIEVRRGSRSVGD